MTNDKKRHATDEERNGYKTTIPHGIPVDAHALATVEVRIPSCITDVLLCGCTAILAYICVLSAVLVVSAYIKYSNIWSMWTAIKRKKPKVTF